MDAQQGKPVAIEAFLGGNPPHRSGLEVVYVGGCAPPAIAPLAPLDEVAMSTDAANAKLQRIDAMLSAYQLGAPFPTYADLRSVLEGR